MAGNQKRKMDFVSKLLPAFPSLVQFPDCIAFFFSFLFSTRFVPFWFVFHYFLPSSLSLSSKTALDWIPFGSCTYDTHQMLLFFYPITIAFYGVLIKFCKRNNGKSKLIGIQLRKSGTLYAVSFLSSLVSIWHISPFNSV